MQFTSRFAAEAATGGYSSWISLGFMVLLLVLMYFLIMRPQKKQEKQVAEMRDNLQIGDEISTTGGILGRIVKIKDDVITIDED